MHMRLITQLYSFNLATNQWRLISTVRSRENRFGSLNLPNVPHALSCCRPQTGPTVAAYGHQLLINGRFAYVHTCDS